MKKVIIVLMTIFNVHFITAQVPEVEIEGRLSIYLPRDTTSIHIGKSAGINQDTTFIRGNIFIGNGAGTKTECGGGNNFLGTMAGYKNIDGSRNCFFGGLAGYYNESGEQNSFFGDSAGSGNQGWKFQCLFWLKRWKRQPKR